MQRIYTLAAASSAAMLVSSATLADQPANDITHLPDAGSVTLSGTVEKVKNPREFLLHDNSGSIEVKIVSSESAVIKQGDSVTVTGAVETPWWGLMGKDIAASDIIIHQDLGAAISDTITKTTGISPDSAERSDIAGLPTHGMVQVSGTVDSVKDKKDFTLRDSSGVIAVNIQSDENVAFTKGAKVSVTGYVDKNMLGRKLSATHVIVTADAQ